jgi:hypothetical protein
MRRLAVAALALLPLWPAAAATEEELAAWRWSAPLLAACLGGDRTAFAYGIDARHRTELRMILQRADGGRDLCAIDRWQRRPPRIEPAPDAPPPEAAAPAFFLERRCVDARRIDAEDGQVLGWLAYPGC